jgi:hypothetical protein
MLGAAADKSGSRSLVSAPGLWMDANRDPHAEIGVRRQGGARTVDFGLIT